MPLFLPSQQISKTMIMSFELNQRNTFGPNPEKENSPDYILDAIERGYDAEIDVWYADKKWYLGHDNAQYLIEESFLKNRSLWCHAKNIETFIQLLKIGAHAFFINEDHATLTSKRYVWLSPTHGHIIPGVICVMPEDARWHDASKDQLRDCRGICSDFVESFRDL